MKVFILGKMLKQSKNSKKYKYVKMCIFYAIFQYISPKKLEIFKKYLDICKIFNFLKKTAKYLKKNIF